MDKKSFYVIVLDDGKGIADDMISSVMNFGAPRDYDELELGKFGVGMKSSSLSQAKEVTLISKVKNGNANLRTPIFIIGIALLFQIFLGVLTILSGVKMLYASLHQINSILIILSTLYFLYILRYKKPVY